MSTNRMHRSNRLLRTIMAMLLIVAMTVQQGAYVLADETVPQPVTEASAPQTQAATEKHTEPAVPAPQPETTAPETKTPETAAPETKAAETAAPETKAPETKAPETAAHETKAAETAAPETAAPETKAPETKAPGTAASKSETKAPETASTEKVRENAVSFVVPEGAKVYVDDKDVTNQKGTARDGKIIFKVVPETGYAIASVKVDDTKDARNTHNENEYVIEGIKTDNTVVRVTMNKVETEKTTEAAESETTADVKESETDTGKEYETSFSTTAHNATITATTTDAAKFPEGTELHADYAAPDTNLYRSTVQTVEQSLGISEDERLSAEGAVYDIYFIYNGERIEPDASVTVKMDFGKPVAADKTDDAPLESGCIMHVADGQAKNVTEAVRTTAKGAITDASFRSDSFSPFFVGGVRRAPGNTTDTQSDNVSKNLNEFTTSVSIEAEKDAWGKYVVKKGSTYTIKLEFQEEQKNNGKQFSNPLTYTLPAGFRDIDQSFKDFAITVEDSTGKYTVSGNSVSLVDGTLTVTFNESDPNWSYLEKARNTQFYLELKGTFDDNAKELDWGNGKKTSLSVDTSGSLTTVKQANYDRSDGKVHYIVTVTSHGYNKNVIVKDSLTGTALTYDQNVTSEVTGGVVKSKTDRGFEYAIPEMTDGQTATLTYTASVNFDALGGGQGTEEQVGNSVVTTSEQQPKSEPVQENWTNKIDYLSISKQAGTASDGTVSGHKTIPWTVTYNADRRGSAAGRTITDSIAENSRSILKYSGDGITVVVTDAGGNVVRTDNVPWANVVGVTDLASASSWHYTIPETDKEAYQYTVSYTTDADLTSVVKDTTVNNQVHDDKGHKSDGSAEVNPGDDNKIGVTKTAGDHDNQTISWTVTLTVPKTGLKTAQMIDTLPTQYVDKQQRYDEWDARSVKVEGLLGGEVMVQDTEHSDQTKAVYTFYQDYQDKEHNTSGLKGGDKVRTITVTFSTKINQDWLNKADPDQTWMMKHTNNVDFVGNGQKVSASAEVDVTKQEIIKRADQSQTITINGKPYPAWHFVIKMKGAAAKDFDVTDTFDARLRYVKPNETVPGLYIGNDGKLTDANGIPYVWNAPVLSADVEDGKVVFHVKKDEVEKFNNREELHISYWLIPKDEASLKEIMQQAAKNGGKTSLTNTASWDNGSAEADASYEYPGLSKKLLMDQSKLNTTDGTQPVATYEIDANPAGAQMGDGMTLVMKDTMSANQVLNPQSVSITPSEGSSYKVSRGDDGGQVLTFTIPDKTPVKIVYSATVTGGNGSQTLKNTAELAGYKSSSENTASKSTTAGGSAANYAVTVFKHEEGDLTKKLSGCTFELHMADPAEDAVWLGSGKKFTTGVDGTVIVESTEGSKWGLEPGTQYYVTEVTAPEGYQLDQTKHYFSISKDGTIDETKNLYLNGATIAVSDKKNVASGKATFSAKKVLNGAALKEDEFEFALKDSSGTTLSTAKNKEDGSVSFDYEASYTQADVGKTYTYTISEVIPEKPEEDMEYDTTVYTVEVTPTDNGNGTLTCTPVYKKGDTETQTATFTNTKTTKGGVTLQVDKELTGRTLQDNEFEFQLLDKDKNILQTAKNVGGKVVFNEITYSKADLAKSPITYTIHESSDKSKEGVTNGEDVTATVTLTNVNNVINASVEYTNGATITNTYRASGQVVLSARKVLKNRNLEEGEFSFTLRNDGDETPAVNETVKNAAPGSDKSATVTFSPIKYDKAGTYKYTITEAEGKDGGVVYDSKISHVTVNVVDDGNGHLTATPKYDGSDEVPTFTNTATLVKVSKVDATNSKELAGATIQILDESSKVVAEWVSTTQAHEVVGLEAGKTYRLHETVAPDGYDLAEQDTTFSINKDGTVNAGTTKSVNGVLLVEDQAKKNALAFDKVSMFGMSMVGAKMAVIRLDAGGESVKDTWTTNGKAHQVEGISDGSYVLRELAAPNGFTLAPDVAFTVRDGKASLKQAGNGRLSTAGAVQVVVMTDAAQLGVRDQRFAKVDEQGKFLPGATLQIKTEEGNVIAEWTTDGSEHTERLIGGTYILTETEAPSGYQVADPISFIVNEKGFIISIGGKAVSGSTDVVVTMTDKKIAAVTKPENEKKQEGKGVKTGDDTPILPMTMTLAISALAVLLILNKRKKETGEQ